MQWIFVILLGIFFIRNFRAEVYNVQPAGLL